MHTWLPCAVFGVNEDNGLREQAAVTRDYLCPSQFNMGESACCAGGRDQHRVLVLFSSPLCTQGETFEIGHRGNYSVAETPP